MCQIPLKAIIIIIAFKDIFYSWVVVISHTQLRDTGTTLFYIIAEIVSERKNNGVVSLAVLYPQ